MNAETAGTPTGTPLPPESLPRHASRRTGPPDSEPARLAAYRQTMRRILRPLSESAQDSRDTYGRAA